MSEENVSAEVTEVSDNTSGANDTVLTEAAANNQADDKIANQETDEAKAETGEAGKDAKKATETDDTNVEVDFDAFELPEGVELDEALAEKAKPIFKELGLKQDDAQKLVSFFAEYRLNEAESAVAQMTDTRKGWVEAIKSEWGNNYESNVATAAKAVQLGGDELREALELTGAGDHPAVIQFFHRVGAAISEDGLVAGDSVVSNKSPLEKRLYPSMKG